MPDVNCKEKGALQINNFVTTILQMQSRSKLAWRIKISLIFLIPTVILYLYFDRTRSLQLDDLYYGLIQNSTKGQGSPDSTHCVIPILNPFDPTVMKYFKKFPRLKCQKIQPSFFGVTKRKLVFNRQEAVKDMTCQYRCIFKHPIDDLQAELGDWVKIDLELNSTKLDCEASQVQCQTVFNSKLYENFFYQIIPKNKFLDEKSQSNWNNSKHLKTSSEGSISAGKLPDTPRPNFIVIVIDSISRSHFIRALPKTYAYLKTQVGVLDFKGLNKVGENTVPNIIPLLTGKPWSSETDRKYNTTFFDDWPIMWKSFASAGYVTLMGEDFPQANLFTNYDRRGFVRQPTDHFMRPFFVTAKESSIWRWSSPFCLDTVPYHKIVTKAAVNMFEEYPFDQPKFAYLQATAISHQDFNDVTQSDDDWLELLQTIKPHLHNSFVIMMGDHGYRFGKVRETLLGQTESRLPAFLMTIPKWFKENYPELVKIAESNSKERLSTFYDAHATALYIAGQGWLETKTVSSNKYQEKYEEPNRGIPLFKPIPVNRTCADTFIPEEFCVCQQFIPVPLDDARILQATRQLLSHVNILLKSHSQNCAHLDLHIITGAAVTLPNRRTLTIDGNKDTKLQEISLIFDVTLIVKPSMAVLQGKVQHFVSSDIYAVQGEVERLNMYGNQSACVSNDRYTKTLCYCIY